ncbi:MAG TPA: HEAT repeat domain-containing protein [Planctomycetes bacterium]|nr:HEAT repeat domain-containing protein [Planctomycetota bacterium]
MRIPPCQGRPRNRPRTAPSGALLFALLTTLGCAGSPPAPASEPYTPVAPPDEDAIGYFLANYDKSLRVWNKLSLAAPNPREQRELRALESSLRDRAKRRERELIDVLENGAPANREVAAVALGFTEDPAVLSPLLSSLSDPRPAVVQKALLGLGILADPATPLSEILFLLDRSPEPWTRNNAAYTIQRVLSAGGGDPQVAVTARTGLFDDEPGVRAQCASILGLLADPKAVQDLGGLLTDDANLVAGAAAAALARIGEEHLETKGEVARLLVDALDRVDSKRRPSLLLELSRLAGRNLGDQASQWREWAYRMP